MRGILVKLVSILTALSYMVAVGGLDVHADHESGRVFVRLLSMGIACEDIHPDSPCHHHHTEGCEDQEDCCSDDILVLSMPGDECHSDDNVPLPAMSFHAVPAFCADVFAGQPFRTECPASLLPRGVPPEPSLHKICIMRV